MERFERKEYKDNLPQHGAPERTAYEFFRVNPSRRAVLVMDKECTIRTLEGEMNANLGDYIIKGINGELYPCKPDIFDKTYERCQQ